ncbi:MAG: hypothetical protein HYR51_12840 [Candidatus Rokubacteria bacterium]|nr:hypothetical protein [Candidatus Rokubacteria bacterium]
MKRRIVVTVCPRERGIVRLPAERGERAIRMDAAALRAHLESLVARRRLDARVEIVEACAGGCASPGPNVSVTVFSLPAPGQRPDDIAVGWRNYVASLATLDCLARVLDDNLGRVTAARVTARGATRRGRSTRR